MVFIKHRFFLKFYINFPIIHKDNTLIRTIIMMLTENTITVNQAASYCDVNRTTVGYWNRSGKLAANRIGKKYAIPVEGLCFYLQSTGQNIPEALKEIERIIT
jgi:excisionase family DNA binding protein